MKVKSNKKKPKQKEENFETNNNEQESPEINILKKDFLDSLDKKEQSLIENKKYNKYNICIKKLYYFAFLKIKKKYDCTSSIYDQYILKYILENIDCHIVSQFKEKMITDYVAEFLRRQYLYSESRDRIPKFSLYYKNYLNFFCKPTYNCFKFNKILQKYGEKKAELYYKENYQGGITNDEGDNGMEESSSDDSSNKEDEYKFNEDGKIFNKLVKEKLDNVTVMTTISSNGNNTINLKMNNEKIEVFSENKAEISNDTTIGEIIDDIKNEMKKIKNKKNKPIKKKYIFSYRNIMNYSLKSQESLKYSRYHKNLSVENRKKGNSKDFANKLLLNRDKKDINKKKIKFSNDKIISQKIKSQIFKYNIESYKINKNRLHKISHEKIQKILKNRYSKNTYNNIYNNNYPYSNFSKDSRINIRNLSSNIKSTDTRRTKKTNISGFSDKKMKNKSRNNIGSLYKYAYGEVNSTTGKSSNTNFQTTHINRSSLTNLVKNGNKIIKTMNSLNTAIHQRTNSQFIPSQTSVKNKSNIKTNTKKTIKNDKKTSSLKFLVTDSENPKKINQTIKIRKNEKLKNKNMSLNNKSIKINNNNKSNNNKKENNIKNKITVTTNNYFNHLNNKNVKLSGMEMKKKFGDYSNENININNQNYSNIANNLNHHQLLNTNVESQTFRKCINYDYKTKNHSQLMKIALSLLIDSNSPEKSKIIKKNLINNISTNNNCNLMKNNIINKKDIQNNFFNINSPTHYNININNQINININGKINGNFNHIRGNKSNKNNTKKKININLPTMKKKNFIPKKKSTQNINSIITNGNKSSNKMKSNKIKIKIKTRNSNDSLKNGISTQRSNNINSRNEKEIKGYHTKSVSNLTEIINHNKRLIALYKNMSKSKEKK